MDFILVVILLKRLDNPTAARFELEHASQDMPNYADLIKFLNKYCTAHDALNISSVSSHLSQKTPTIRPSKIAVNNARSFLTKGDNGPECFLCKGKHFIFYCASFLKKTPQDSFIFCKANHLCFNCLSSFHDLKTCKSVSTCRDCHQSCHPLLHLNTYDRQVEGISSSNTVKPVPTTNENNKVLPISSTEVANNVDTAAPSSSKVFSALSETVTVLLSTALVAVQDRFGQFHVLRALLDSGSMTSFITQNAVSHLRLSRQYFPMQVTGLNSTTIGLSKGRVHIAFRPVDQPDPIIYTEVIVLPKITDNLPSTDFCTESWSYVANVKLADPSFSKPGLIGLLLGADVFSKINFR